MSPSSKSQRTGTPPGETDTRQTATSPKNRLQSLSNGGKSGKEVFIIQNLHQQYADQVLFKDSSFAVYRGDHLAIIGDNGAGKSTLLKLLLGEEKPYGGTIKLGSSLQIGYLPQQLQFADPDSRLLAYAITLTGNEEVARRQLAKSGFYQSDVGKRIKDLSGGEKIRLALLKLFLEKINVLILDEPTNHLDSYAREEIEEMLQDYQGTLLAVSHDRYFCSNTSKKHSLLIRSRSAASRSAN